MTSFWKRLIYKFRPDYESRSVRGDRLLREAKREIIDDEEVFHFSRILTPKEMELIREAWNRAYPERKP